MVDTLGDDERALYGEKPDAATKAVRSASP
jgi:hypothetical protein